MCKQRVSQSLYRPIACMTDIGAECRRDRRTVYAAAIIGQHQCDILMEDVLILLSSAETIELSSAK